MSSGSKLRALGSAFQVLCITHLPQIAAYADTHFQIEKRVEEGRTRTSVARLDDRARVEELGRMLGGAAVTDGDSRVGARDAGRGDRPPAATQAKRRRKAKAKGRKAKPIADGRGDRR